MQRGRKTGCGFAGRNLVKCYLLRTDDQGGINYRAMENVLSDLYQLIPFRAWTQISKMELPNDPSARQAKEKAQSGLKSIFIHFSLRS